MVQLLLCSLISFGAQTPPRVDPVARIQEWIARNVPSRSKLDAAPVAITDAAIAHTWPGGQFFSLHFSEFPVARMAPKPLAQRNIFAVSKSGEVTLASDPKHLEMIFASSAARFKDEFGMRDVTVAWLRLSEEFSQDGFFKFSIPADQIKLDLRTGHSQGKVSVDPKGGDRGEIFAMLTFRRDRDGWRFKTVVEKRSVQPGVRPICQCTKLLDPDPIVRRMAERDLLVMGRSAEAYIRQQRSMASPELQKAIDRIWKRILAGER